MDDRELDGETDSAVSGGPTGDSADQRGDEPTQEAQPYPGPDATQEAPLGDPDATRITGADAEAGPTVPTGVDGTQVMPPVEDDPTEAVPRLRPAADTTVVLSQGDVPPYRRSMDDSTSVQPPVPDGWKGQATVRPAGMQRESDQWSSVPPPDRAWWLPILLGLAGLTTILAIAYVLVVATKGAKNPAPAVTPSTPASSVAPSSIAASAPPSAPSAPPSGLPSGPVLIPSVLIGGIGLDAAEQTLTSLGLAFTAVAQVDAGHTPGTVIGVLPAVGSLVPPGTVVTLYYAIAPTPSLPPSVPPSVPPSIPPSAPPSSATKSS